jgi:glycosyltransferase involved in cell wall biosynthesis
MPPLVSVVLPVRDAAGTIGRAIASVQAQTLREWELVVVDDGSTDGTADLLATRARQEPRLRVLRRPAEGLVAALNAGLAAAQGEFVARLDADDEALPERLAAQVEFLRAPAQRDIGVASCLVEHAGDRAAQSGYALHVDWLNTLVTPEAIALNRFVEAPVAHPSVLFRRELVARHGGYRAGDFPEDYELWLRWLDAGVRFAKVPRMLLRWHDPPGRLSRRDPRYASEAFFRLKAAWLARWLRAEGVGSDGVAGAARALWIWGAGRPTRKRAAHLEAHGMRIAGYVDVDPKKFTPAIGGTGLPVVGPAALPPAAKALVVGYVSTRGARDLIRGELLRRGRVEGRDFLLAA